MTLPAGQYGDTSVTGDTGGDAYRTAGVYASQNDGFKITGWDDIGYFMNYGVTVDGKNDADYIADGGLDVVYSDFEIVEGQAYAGGTNYQAHNKALTNKFYINVPIVRFGATNRYDRLGNKLIPDTDTEELMKQFGKQAKTVQTQYIRSTLINLATPAPARTFTDGGTEAELTAMVKYLNTAKQNLKVKGGEQFIQNVKASDGVGTVPVRSGYVAIIHSSMENIIQELPGFVHYTKYGNGKPVLSNEFGMVPETEIRFVVNDLLVQQSGTSSIGIVDVFDATNGLTSYNMLIMAKNAYVIATLEGDQRYKMYIKAPGSGQDVLEMEKLCGWKTIMGCAVKRPAWIYNVPITIATTP